MKPLYIFDLDGTLADLKHRRHFVEQPPCTVCGWLNKGRTCIACSARSPFKPNWDAFHAACVDDTPIAPLVTLFRTLMWNSAGSDGTVDGVDIWIWSGRSDAVRAQTETWLDTHLGTWFDWLDKPEVLKMRRAGDYTPDDDLKHSWYQAMSVEDRRRLVAVFDDRDRVVAMWRKQGVVCLQCAPGDF